ncbi:LacI family DNA-binding transcriptional regulator [Ferdinandcohnia quinoae]|uniref:LacI family transcriptional regulator n=1 Tax=Fredinandcohnia quinoae TaxID=2918902 RepID=A0AAW5E7N1_9BACI|nr:LacI family DNA-binding transcriptional regulator [Fredinandcohnia sp. SECRCQ15]MCH1626016.1 LacI family transcriptional regulator [Fredinandcohnia sp. SECRCQ15]
MATLKDIAKHANVSTCTVSRYLNSNIVVKKETEVRIEEAIKKLGYVPNIIAKSLKQQETSNVAVILPKLNHLYYSEVTSGISQTLAEHHYNIFIYEVDNLHLDEEGIMNLMRENMVAGIVFIGLFPDTSFQEKIKEVFLGWKIPVVYTNRCIPYDGFPLLYPNLVKASKIGTEHLIKRKKEKIAFMHKPLPKDLLNQFLKGYREAINRDHEPLFIEISDDKNVNKEYVQKLIEHQINGVFVLDEKSAVYLTKTLAKSNIQVPYDIAVLSLGNSLISEISTPELTCVDLQNRVLGQKSAEIILNQILNKTFEDVTVLEPFIVEREST